MFSESVCEGEIRVISARPKVLIVEDEAIIAEDIRLRLESYGYQIIGIADSGRIAIEIAKKYRPDVVLVDFHIKNDLNGIETAVCLQGLYERPMPIVFVTAFWDEHTPLIAAISSCAIVKKPFSTQELTSNILKVMFTAEM
jgi:two-component system, response regulator PdtaR